MNRILFIVVVVIAMGCESSRKLSNQNLAYLYTPTLNFIYPDYRVCNIQPDSSRVFFSLLSSELLYMKLLDTNSFQAAIAINYMVLSNYESKVPIDSGTVYYNFEQMEDSLTIISNNF